jgi:hypothetical protein
VFLGEHGGTMDGSALRRRYLKDRASAGLRELRFHDLRGEGAQDLGADIVPDRSPPQHSWRRQGQRRGVSIG